MDSSAGDQGGDWAVRPSTLLLVFILLIGACLRCYQLGEESLWYDESASLFYTQYINGELDFLNPAHSLEAPINSLLLKGWVMLIGALFDYPANSVQRDFLLRLWPCGWSILAIALLYWVTKRLLKNEPAALIAALFMAISPFYVRYGQELRIYAFFICACLVGLLCVVEALESGKRRWWLLMPFSFSIMVQSHFISIWIIVACNLYFVGWWWRERRYLGAWTVANACNLLLSAPGLQLAWRLNQLTKGIKYAWYPSPTLKTCLLTFKSFYAGFGPTVWAYWPLFLVMGAAFVIGLGCFVRPLRRVSLLGLCALFPILMGYLIWGYGAFSFYEHRVFIFSGVVALMPIAAAFAAIPKPAVRTAAVLAVVGLSLPLLNDHYQHRLHPIPQHRLAMWDKVDYRSACAYIAAHRAPDDLIGCTNHFLFYSIDYYLGEAPVVIGRDEEDAQVMLDTLGTEAMPGNHGMLPVAKEAATAGRDRVWLLRSRGTTFEYQPISETVQAWFDENWRVLERHSFDGLDLTLYARQAE